MSENKIKKVPIQFLWADDEDEGKDTRRIEINYSQINIYINENEISELIDLLNEMIEDTKEWKE